MRALPLRVRRLVHGLRTEPDEPGRDPAAIGVGVFIGCLPLYGFHLLLCAITGTVLRLNRFKMYLASNISNPLIAPWLLLAELQAGAWLRRGTIHGLDLHSIQSAGIGGVSVDLALGSVVIGGALAVLAAGGTFALVGRGVADPAFARLLSAAANRYTDTSITAWEFARGKLRHDPIYRALIDGGLLTATVSGGTLVDIGCGQGLALALLNEARARPQGPRFDRLIGIEWRPRVAAIATAALGSDAEIIEADARARPVEHADVILLLDVLHMMSRSAQESLLAAARGSVAAGGAIVIREADAAAGGRFRMVAFGNRLKALASGQWTQRFDFRTVAEWESCFASLGLSAETRAMGHGTPFANVVFLVTPAALATPSTRRTDTRTAGVR
jgi:uncharacterized protein (DUF2062 family)